MTPRPLWAPLAFAGGFLVLALAACTDSAEPGTNGTAGTPATGGSSTSGGVSGGGAGGSSGQGGSSSGSGGAAAGTSGKGGTGGAASGGGGSGGGSGGAGAGAGGTTAGAGGAGAEGGGAQGGTAGSGAGQAGSSGAGGDQGGSSGSSGSSGAGAGGAGGSGGSGGGNDLDVFGIRKLYPSASSGAEWTSEHWDGDAYSIDEREDPNDPSGLSGFRGTGTLEVTGDGELVMGGSQPRIYIYPGAAPWRDLEITVYYQRVEDAGQAYAGLVVGVRSGEDGHSSGTECDAHTYYGRVRNDGAFDFEKELKHPASSTQSRIDPDTVWPPDGEVPRNTWIGFKYVIYNVGSTVKLEAYRDMTNGENGGDWELVNETVDDGGWSVETDCAEHSPSGGESDMIVLDGGTTMIRNTDVTEARYRWVTMREIAPP